MHISAEVTGKTCKGFIGFFRIHFAVTTDDTKGIENKMIADLAEQGGDTVFGKVTLFLG